MQFHAAEEGIKGVKVKVERGNGHPEVACLREGCQLVTTGHCVAASN